MVTKGIIQYYTGFAESYDEIVLRDKDYTAFEKISRWVIRASQRGKGIVLDLGCGTGLSSRFFFEQKCEVTGVDITPKMIEKCACLPFKNLICQSLEDSLPLGDAQFDAAVLIGVMEFIQNTRKLFKETVRVLKPKGFFGLTVPRKLLPEIESKLGILTYDPLEIEPLFEEAGFCIQHTELFQGFIFQDEVVHYQGYLLRKL